MDIAYSFITGSFNKDELFKSEETFTDIEHNIYDFCKMQLESKQGVKAMIESLRMIPSTAVHYRVCLKLAYDLYKRRYSKHRQTESRKLDKTSKEDLAVKEVISKERKGIRSLYIRMLTRMVWHSFKHDNGHAFCNYGEFTPFLYKFWKNNMRISKTLGMLVYVLHNTNAEQFPLTEREKCIIKQGLYKPNALDRHLFEKAQAMLLKNGDKLIDWTNQLDDFQKLTETIKVWHKQ